MYIFCYACRFTLVILQKYDTINPSTNFNKFLSGLVPFSNTDFLCNFLLFFPFNQHKMEDYLCQKIQP